MRGDVTRDTFDAEHHYTRVVMQQGRVQLDADWNEQAAIGAYRLRRLAADLIGPHGGPAADLGFGLTADVAVVDRVRDRFGRRLDGARARSLQARLRRSDFLIGTGRYYVDGLMCENDEPITYGLQTGYPFTSDTGLAELRGVSRFLVYLDVWERHVTALEDPGLLEPALGGADTTTRAQLVWQVKVLRPTPPATEATVADLAALATRPGCAMRARTTRSTGVSGGTAASPHGYRGMEDRLYRVEIHAGGAAWKGAGSEGATFTWSRANGSVAFAVRDIRSDPADGSTVVELAALGRDATRTLSPGNWVEVVDEPTALRCVGGPLRKVRSIRPDGRTVVLDGTVEVDVEAGASRPVLLRRWDHGLDVAGDDAVRVVESELGTPRWLDLEDGVQVQFPREHLPGVGNEYRPGDYWLIPARQATRGIEWPAEDTGEADPPSLAMPPRGVRHAYAPLAQASMSASGELTIPLADLRRSFAGAAE